MSIRIGNKIIASTRPGVATENTLGLVKPDNETTFVDENGVISSQIKNVIFRDWSV